jgi:hypothetical protein
MQAIKKLQHTHVSKRAPSIFFALALASGAAALWGAPERQQHALSPAPIAANAPSLGTTIDRLAMQYSITDSLEIRELQKAIAPFSSGKEAARTAEAYVSLNRMIFELNKSSRPGEQILPTISGKEFRYLYESLSLQERDGSYKLLLMWMRQNKYSIGSFGK